MSREHESLACFHVNFQFLGVRCPVVNVVSDREFRPGKEDHSEMQKGVCKHSNYLTRRGGPDMRQALIRGPDMSYEGGGGSSQCCCVVLEGEEAGVTSF